MDIMLGSESKADTEQNTGVKVVQSKAQETLKTLGKNIVFHQ